MTSLPEACKRCRRLDAVAAVVARPGEDDDPPRMGRQREARAGRPPRRRAPSARTARRPRAHRPRCGASPRLRTRRHAARESMRPHRSRRCGSAIGLPSLMRGAARCRGRRSRSASCGRRSRRRAGSPSRPTSAQPLPPWPTLSQMPVDAAGAEHRRTVGQHRPRALPALRGGAPRHAGEPVVEHLVERRLRALALALGSPPISALPATRTRLPRRLIATL